MLKRPFFQVYPVGRLYPYSPPVQRHKIRGLVCMSVGEKEKERNCPSVTPKIVEGNATDLFIHSLSLLLLSIYYVIDTVMGTLSTEMNVKVWSLPSGRRLWNETNKCNDVF